MTNYKESYSNYQRHIDGIRAFAVLIVWLFHLDQNLFSGGYLGVDIFFVISGYVITLSIFKSYEKTKKFNLLNFYKKRFYRIFPALFFVISTSFIVYLYFGYLFELIYVSKISAASLLGISNLFYIFLKNDYFLQNELNPFIHTWSLGVEEQFYILYPFLLLIIILLLRNFYQLKNLYFFLKILLVFVIIISFLIFAFYSNTVFGNFYSPLARFWEILIGCLIYFSVKNFKINLNIFVYIFAFIIFCLIILLDNRINNIYISIVFSIFFSFLLITTNNSYVLVILNNKLMSYLGKISYSMYLWHLPLLYFNKIYLQNSLLIPSNIFLLLILSSLTYYFIETPIRHNKKIQKYFLWLLIVGLTSFVILYSNNLINNKGMEYNSYFNKEIIKINNIFKNKNFFEKKYNLSERAQWDVYINGQSIFNCEITNSNFKNNNDINNQCIKKTTKEKLFIIVGDSHGTHYYPMLEGSKNNASIYLQTYEGCFFVPDIYTLGKQDYKKNNFKYFNNCQNYINKEKLKIKKLSREYKDIYLFISSRYTAYFEKAFLLDQNKNIIQKKDFSFNISRSLNDFVSEFENIKIVFVSPLPEFDFYPFSCFLDQDLCLVERKKDIARIQLINDLFVNLSLYNHNVFLFNPYDYICPIELTNCKIYEAKQDLLLFRDKDHLTVEGSKFFISYFDEWFDETFNSKN